MNMINDKIKSFLLANALTFVIAILTDTLPCNSIVLLIWAALAAPVLLNKYYSTLISLFMSLLLGYFYFFVDGEWYLGFALTVAYLLPPTLITYFYRAIYFTAKNL